MYFDLQLFQEEWHTTQFAFLAETGKYPERWSRESRCLHREEVAGFGVLRCHGHAAHFRPGAKPRAVGSPGQPERRSWKRSALTGRCDLRHSAKAAAAEGTRNSENVKTTFWLSGTLGGERHNTLLLPTRAVEELEGRELDVGGGRGKRRESMTWPYIPDTCPSRLQFLCPACPAGSAVRAC